MPRHTKPGTPKARTRKHRKRRGKNGESHHTVAIRPARCLDCKTVFATKADLLKHIQILHPHLVKESV